LQRSLSSGIQRSQHGQSRYELSDDTQGDDLMGSLHREVLRALTWEIVCETRASGEVLTEVQLAAEFEVSRGVVREAIRALEERGLVTVEHGRGAKVNVAGSWNQFDHAVLAAMVDAGHGSEVFTELLECRRIVEVDAAGLAAARVRNRELDVMELALGRMEVAVIWPNIVGEERFDEAQIAFHSALIAAADNPALSRLIERVHCALMLATRPLADCEDRQERALTEHRRILEALKAGDIREARQAMDAHLDTIADYLTEHQAAGGSRRRRERASRRAL
jgi:DNA-binding FadR family transcriptional regulator